MRAIDMVGKKFNRLTVLKRDYNGKKNIFWECVCDCGNSTSVDGAYLRSGHTKSCGCLNIENRTKHNQTKGGKKTPTYTSWGSMRARCYNPNHEDFKHYGGRGIKVCERWNDFSLFLKDMGERPSLGVSIDRIDVNGDYEPDNCKWSTLREQNFNRRLDKNNKTGLRGVRKSANGLRYTASISVNNKTNYLGTFDTKEEAFEARKKAEIKHYGRSLM